MRSSDIPERCTQRTLNTSDRSTNPIRVDIIPQRFIHHKPVSTKKINPPFGWPHRHMVHMRSANTRHRYDQRTTIREMASHVIQHATDTILRYVLEKLSSRHNIKPYRVTVPLHHKRFTTVSGKQVVRDHRPLSATR